MSVSHSIEQNWESAGRRLTSQNVYSAGAQSTLDEAIPDESTDLELVFTLDVSEIESIIIICDQDLTLKTNNATTPVDTLDLLAGLPYIWTVDSYFENKLTTDITALFVTNASGKVANLHLEEVHDPTP